MDEQTALKSAAQWLYLNYVVADNVVQARPQSSIDQAQSIRDDRPDGVPEASDTFVQTL